MERFVRTVIIRISPLAWIAAAVLSAFPRRWPLAVVLAAFALGGTLAGAINASHLHDVITLGRALADSIGDGDLPRKP